MKVFFTVLISLLPFFGFGQCNDNWACNYLSTDDCNYAENNSVNIVGSWVYELDNKCDGSVELSFLIDYFADGSYAFDGVLELGTTWSLCNDQYTDTWGDVGVVQENGDIIGFNEYNYSINNVFSTCHIFRYLLRYIMA